MPLIFLCSLIQTLKPHPLTSKHGHVRPVSLFPHSEIKKEEETIRKLPLWLFYKVSLSSDQMSGGESSIIFRVFSTDYMLNTRCVRQLPPASQIHVVPFSLFWAQCTHAQSNPFYHRFYPDVTHVRKIPGSLPLYHCTGKRWKAGRGLETRLVLYCVLHCPCAIRLH